MLQSDKKDQKLDEAISSQSRNFTADDGTIVIVEYKWEAGPPHKSHGNPYGSILKKPMEQWTLQEVILMYQYHHFASAKPLCEQFEITGKVLSQLDKIYNLLLLNRSQERHDGKDGKEEISQPDGKRVHLFNWENGNQFLDIRAKLLEEQKKQSSFLPANTSASTPASMSPTKHGNTEKQSRHRLVHYGQRAESAAASSCMEAPTSLTAKSTRVSLDIIASSMTAASSSSYPSQKKEEKMDLTTRYQIPSSCSAFNSLP